MNRIPITLLDFLPSTPGGFIQWAIVLVLLICGVRRIRQARRSRFSVRDTAIHQRAVKAHFAKLLEDAPRGGRA